MAHRKAKLRRDTIEYYDKHADEFVASTKGIDMREFYERFEKYLSPHAHVLDLGCGSGRDSLHFFRRGYEVTALDPSAAMCKKTRELVNIPVHQIVAEDMTFKEEFDGIWACASLLHVPSSDMADVLRVIVNALKCDGVLYCSWKYGDSEREEDGRFFSDNTERKIKKIVRQIDRVEIVDIWVTEDLRDSKNFPKWLNVIMRKRRNSREKALLKSDILEEELQKIKR